MTSVANQPVGADSLGAVKPSGGKSQPGMRESYLGGPVEANGKFRQVSAGTLGGPAGTGGQGLPHASAPVLTSIEKALKDQGV